MTQHRRSCGAQHGGRSDTTANGRAIADGGTAGDRAGGDRSASDRRTAGAESASATPQPPKSSGDAGESGSFGIDIGAVGIGLVSIIGGFAAVLGSLQGLYHISRFSRVSMVELLQSDVIGFVVVPVVLLLVWFLVGAVLIVGRTRAAPIGAAAFLLAVPINVAVFVTEQIGVRPALLWYVDPVSSIIMLPVDELLYRAIIQSEFFWHAPGFVGTLLALLFAGYFGVQSARRYVL